MNKRWRQQGIVRIGKCRRRLERRVDEFTEHVVLIAGGKGGKRPVIGLQLRKQC
mgnify:CR=1 FL=1